jgi:hypothetical protein
MNRRPSKRLPELDVEESAEVSALPVADVLEESVDDPPDALVESEEVPEAEHRQDELSTYTRGVSSGGICTASSRRGVRMKTLSWRNPLKHQSRMLLN